MLILCLEPVEWRRLALSESFSELAGATVDLEFVSQLGLLQAELLDKAQTLLVPPKLQSDELLYEAQDLILLCWHLACSHPNLKFIHFREEQDGQDSPKEPWSETLELETSVYPETSDGYQEWVAGFCKSQGIRYQAPPPTREWWSQRRWLIWSTSEDCVAYDKIHDTELVSDLVGFFHLKTNQLLDCLGEKEWVTCTLEGEKSSVEFRPGRADSVAFTQLLPGGESSSLPDVVCESLVEMGLLRREG